MHPGKCGWDKVIGGILFFQKLILKFEFLPIFTGGPEGADKSSNGNQGDEWGGSDRGRWQREWRGASVTSVDGDAADGIRPSHCERGEVDTWPMCADVRRVVGWLSDMVDGIRLLYCEGGEVDTWPMCADVRRAVGRLTAYARCVGIVAWRWCGWRYTSFAMWRWRSRHLTDVRGLMARRGSTHCILTITLPLQWP